MTVSSPLCCLSSAPLMMQQAEFASAWKSPAGRDQTDWPLSEENCYSERPDLCGMSAFPEACVQSTYLQFQWRSGIHRANAVEWPVAREI